MTTVLDLLENLQSLHLEDEVNKAIDETEGVLVDDIRKQLYAGTDATSNKITPKYRRPRYARVKFDMNPKPGLFTPDLKLTGLFYNEMTANRQGQIILFDSGVSYANALSEKYSEQILEPSELSLDEYSNDNFYPKFINNIENKTGLTFK